MAANLQVTGIDIRSIDTSRYEQIGGELEERPVPKDRHADVQGNVIELLGPLARSHGMRAYPELSVDETDAPDADWMTPDVLLTKPDYVRSKRRNALPPLLLAIEILSIDQTVPDMIRKAKRYLQWGIENTWLIEPEKQFALVLSKTDPDNPALVLPGFDLKIGEISVPLSEVLA